MGLPQPSPKEYLILDMLRSGQELYGLEMVKANPKKLKRGTIYVTLMRMEEKGYVSSRHEKDPRDPGMPRRMFMITGKGVSALSIADASLAAAKAAGWEGSYA